MDNNVDSFKYVFNDENNVEKEYEILLSFKSDKYNKVYYVMTDNELGVNNKLNTYVFSLNPNEKKADVDEMPDVEFIPIEDEEELKYVNDVFSNVQKGV